MEGPGPNLWVAEYLRLVSGGGPSCYSPALVTEASRAAGTSEASAEATETTLDLGQATETLQTHGVFWDDRVSNLLAL